MGGNKRLFYPGHWVVIQYRAFRFYFFQVLDLRLSLVLYKATHGFHKRTFGHTMLLANKIGSGSIWVLCFSWDATLLVTSGRGRKSLRGDLLKGGPQVDRDNSWDLHSVRIESLWSLKGALYLDSVGESGWMWVALCPHVSAKHLCARLWLSAGLIPELPMPSICYWLVVDLRPWKMMGWKSVGMIIPFPIWWESHNPCSSHHQPGTNFAGQSQAQQQPAVKPLQGAREDQNLQAVVKLWSHYYWLVVQCAHLEKHESQWEGWHPIYDGKNVPNHQPDYDCFLNMTGWEVPIWMAKSSAFKGDKHTCQGELLERTSS